MCLRGSNQGDWDGLGGMINMNMLSLKKYKANKWLERCVDINEGHISTNLKWLGYELH